MISIPKDYSELTPAWISAVLSEAGAAGADHLRAVRMRSNPAFNSTVTHLDLEYFQPIYSSSLSSTKPSSSSPAVIAPPSSVLVKLNQHGDGETEVLFYQAASSLELPFLVHCYAAQYDPITGRSFLLLDDISPSHQPPVTRQALFAGQGVPDQSTLIGIAETLARFHAAWWQRQLDGPAAALTAVRSWYANTILHTQHYQRRMDELDHFLSNAGANISNDSRRLLEGAVERLPYLWMHYVKSRVESYQKMTLSHGDCYLTQFLSPIQPGSAPVCLVDFDSASGNFPAYDLVYLLSTFWSRAQRLGNARERHFLLHYHTILCQAGVENYCFADLCQDYRLMLCYMLLDAPADQVRGSPASYWQPKLRCLAEAYEDWECEAL
jgi:hypothetical protein